MSDWLIRSRYGFGAARLPLCAEPHALRGEWWGLFEAARRAGACELGLRNAAGLSPALAMGLVIAIAPLLAILQRPFSTPDIDLVVLQTAALSEPAPVPRPETLRAPESPVREPKDLREPEPPPIVPTAPREAPDPVVLRPLQKAPPPSPPVPVSRLAAQRSQPKPTVTIEPLRSASAHPARHPAARPSRPAAASPTRPGFEPVVRIDAPPDTKATTQVAAVRSERGIVPSDELASRRPAPTFGAPPRSPLPSAAAQPPRRNSLRAVAPGPARASRAAPARSVDFVREKTRLPQPAPASMAPDRVREAPRGGGSPSQRNDPQLAGVPLAALASCVSDREEDALKQRVLAAVGRRSLCESPAGQYVFVETRNLNSFLMVVRPSPTRRPADRCVELSHALECLTRPNGSRAGHV